jgi:hypothetical protein
MAMASGVEAHLPCHRTLPASSTRRQRTSRCGFGCRVDAHVTQRLGRAPVLPQPGQRRRTVRAALQHGGRHRHQGMQIERAGLALADLRHRPGVPLCHRRPQLPNMPEHRLLPLIQRFAEMLVSSGLFGGLLSVTK